MSNVVEFIVKLKDLMSGGMSKLGTTASSTFSKLEQTQANFQKSNVFAGNSISSLEEKVKKLREQASQVQIMSPADLVRLRAINSEANKLEQRVSKMRSMNGSKLMSWGKDALNQIPGAGLVTNPLVLAGTAAAFSMKQAMGMQDDKVKMSTLMGSEAKGNAMFENIQSFANTTPYMRNELMGHASTMLGFGIDEKKIMPYMKMLGDVSMGNSDKMQSLVLAFSQIQSAGRLMGQDLLQLVNAGFNPLGIISQQTGKSMAELKDLMEKGAISSEMVAQAFKVATDEGGRYHGMMEKMNKTAGGQWSNFMDKLSVTAGNLGMMILPVLTKTLSGVNTVMEFLINNANTLIPGLGVVTGLFVAVNAQMLWTSTIGRLASISVTLMNGSFAKLTATMMANPMVRIAAAVFLLIEAVKYAWEHFEWFRGAVMGTWEVLKSFGTMLKDFVIDRIKGLISGLSGMGKALWKFFTGDFKGAFEVGKQAIKDLTGVDAMTDLYNGAKNLGKIWDKGYADGVNSNKHLISEAMWNAKKNQLKWMSDQTASKYSVWMGNPYQKGNLVSFMPESIDMKGGKNMFGDFAKDKGEKMGGSIRSITFHIANLGIQGDITMPTQETVRGGVRELRRMVQEEFNRLIDGTGGALVD